MPSWIGLTRLLLCILVFTSMASALRAEPNDRWSGSWGVYWSGGVARIELVSRGDTVVGSIPLHGGSITAHASGSELSGEWNEAGWSGHFVFRMAPDDGTFSGSFDNGTWWSGRRITQDASRPARDQSTPRAALRSFLLAGAQAQLGIPDAIGGTAMVSQFQGLASGLPIMQQVQVAQDMFDLVDTTTVTLWRIPDAPFDQTVRVTLPQAGTTAVLPLTLQRLHGGLWWVIVPDLSTLEEAKRTLLARYGGRFAPTRADPSLPSPRDTLRAFMAGLDAWGGVGRDDALATLDLSRLPEATRSYDGELAALALANVLERVEPVIPQTIPDDPGSRDLVILFQHPAGRIAIGPVGDGLKARWQFTDDTVETARGLYASIAAMPVREDAIVHAPSNPAFALRAAAGATAPWLLWPVGSRLLEIWQVVGSLFTVIVAATTAAAVVAGMSALPDPLGGWSGGLVRPVWLTTFAAVWLGVSPALGLPHLLFVTSSGLASVSLAVGLVWGGWQAITLAARRLARRGGRGRSMADEIFTPLAVDLLRMVLVTGALAYVAKALSIPYNGVLAGVGISGLAMALASKDTLASVLGAAILMSERPFRRGDVISAGDTLGTVEHVGIRSTRIRTAEGSMIMLPNYKLTDATVTNLGTRRHVLVTSALQLPYSVSPEALSAFVDAAAGMLAARPDVVPDRTEVAVTGLGPEGMHVEIICYLNAGSSKEEKAVRQALMLDIIRLGDRMDIPIGTGHTPRSTPGLPAPASAPQLPGPPALAGTAAFAAKAD